MSQSQQTQLSSSSKGSLKRSLTFSNETQEKKSPKKTNSQFDSGMSLFPTQSSQLIARFIEN